MRMFRICVALAMAALILLPFSPAPSVAQQAAVQVKTPYPAVVVEAGKSVKFDLQVVTASPRRVDLAVAEIPEGWQATLRGGGFVIDGVFGDPETPPSVELDIRIPPDAEAGDHRVAVRGTAPGGSDTLNLTLRVSDSAPGAVALTAEFPSFRGAANESFTFRLSLENNTPEETSFSLAAEGPQGWLVEARPTVEARAATVTVEGGGTSDVEVSVDPPDDATAGEYPILVRANGPGDQRAETELTVEITGSFQMLFTTSDERESRDVRAGRGSEVELQIRNDGTTPLQQISLQATPPSGWEVEFSPETVDAVEPGQAETVTARIAPSGDAVAGDYRISFTASSDEGSETFELRATVQPSRFWIVVGLLLILGTVVALRQVFQRYGRR